MKRESSYAWRAFACRTAIALVVSAALLAASSAGADSGPTPQVDGIAGAVAADSTGTAHRERSNELARPGVVRRAAKGKADGVNVTWHGGPVLHSNTTYAIFWDSTADPMPQGYEATVVQYLKDVAHDSGGTSNVYSVDPQYTDASSRAAYDSTFGGSWEDTATPLADHCSKEYSSTARLSGCVLDDDLRTEVSHAIAVNGWPTDPGAVYFVLTPPAVGSCADTTSKDCAYRTYCAYHSFFTQGSANIVYADIPYPDATSSGAPPGVCDTGEQPNGNWGDEAINLMSHEHNESITDPLLNAWYDSEGQEVADKCAWGYGNALGGVQGATGAEGTEWNQVINGDHYYLQREWDNATSSCVQQSGQAPTVPLVSGMTPSSGPPGTVVTLTGWNFTGASVVKFNGVKAAFNVVDDQTLTASVPATATTGIVSVVTPIGTAKSPIAFTVTQAPITFGLSLDPPQSVTAGNDATYTITLTRGPGFTGAVPLSVLVAPDASVAPTWSLSAKTIAAGSTTATVTIKTKKTTTPGVYTVTVTGAIGDVSQTATTGITINAPATR